MATIRVLRKDGKLVCDRTSTPAKRGELIHWQPVGVGNDVVFSFEGKSPFTDSGRTTFPITEDQTISPTAENGKYKFKHIEGDIEIRD
jgi:hypothetical protein